MFWKRYLFVGWITILIAEYQTDESLSFSPSQSRSLNLPISYWYVNKTFSKESSLLEEGVDIDLYLNKYQGLLFYSIDSKSQTFWVEFNQNLITFNYYNFRIDDVDKRIDKLESICGDILDSKVNLKFILMGQELVVKCNGNTLSINYFPPTGDISDTMFDTFIKTMVLPIPFFSKSNGTEDNVVHMWVGNTPTTNDNSYANKVQLKNNPLNLLGCIMRFAIGDIPLKMASSGFHVGEMLSKSCNPVCQTIPCMNNGRCIELWRGRFSCNCSASRFIGRICDEDYAVKFDGNLDVRFTKYFKLQKLQFSFQPVIYGESGYQKLLSVKFYQESFIQVYRDSNYFINARFLSPTKHSIEIRFQSALVDYKNYTFSIETDLNGLIFKMGNPGRNYVVDRKTMQLSDNNLIINEVLLGNSHISTMEWMKKFHGCISNFVLTYNQKQFVWNEISQFPTLPKCGQVAATQSTAAAIIPSEEPLKKKNLIAQEQSKKGDRSATINNSNTTFIAIGISCLIVLIIGVIIVVFTCRRRDSKKSTYEEKLILKPNHAPIENSDPPYIIPNTVPRTSVTPVIFKPAYVARSMNSSINGRSLISLPSCTTPTLVTPEDFLFNI